MKPPLPPPPSPITVGCSHKLLITPGSPLRECGVEAARNVCDVRPRDDTRALSDTMRNVYEGMRHPRRVRHPPFVPRYTAGLWVYSWIRLVKLDGQIKAVQRERWCRVFWPGRAHRNRCWTKKKREKRRKKREERTRGRKKQKRGKNCEKKKKGWLCFTVESRPLIDESVKTTFVEARSCSKVILSLVRSFHVSL